MVLTVRIIMVNDINDNDEKEVLNVDLWLLKQREKVNGGWALPLSTSWRIKIAREREGDSLNF